MGPDVMVAIDVGGTGIKAAQVCADGTVRHRQLADGLLIGALFDVERIVVGGRLAKAGEALLAPEPV
ncbi:MAG: hypothetical protein GEV12_04680 [Micromonosporaceae bacterium]|nr:hypothetical protein [Micromonosporaceae bacterium]